MHCFYWKGNFDIKSWVQKLLCCHGRGFAKWNLFLKTENDVKSVSWCGLWKIGVLVKIFGFRNVSQRATITLWKSSLSQNFFARRFKFTFYLGSYDIVHIKDAAGHVYATRLSNIFIVGKGNKAMVTLPKGKGVRLTIAEERDRRMATK